MATIAHGQIVHAGIMEALRQDGSLEQKFLAVVGGEAHAQHLSWLEDPARADA